MSKAIRRKSQSRPANRYQLLSPKLPKRLVDPGADFEVEEISRERHEKLKEFLF
jgi:hypothetical protein